MLRPRHLILCSLLLLNSGIIIPTPSDPENTTNQPLILQRQQQRKIKRDRIKRGLGMLGLIALTFSGMGTGIGTIIGSVNDNRSINLLPDNGTLPMDTSNCTYSPTIVSPDDCPTNSDLCDCGWTPPFNDQIPYCTVIEEKCGTVSYDNPRFGYGLVSFFTNLALSIATLKQYFWPQGNHV